MTPYPSTRINMVEQVETWLKGLTSQGYDTTALWREHNNWLAEIETRAITDEDRTWATQLPEPAVISDHFVNGQPEVLTAARTHFGRQYSLSPGQREVLRDRYGLTPTLVVTAENVELFPEDDVIYSLTLRSVEHVDPRRRTRVLNSVVLAPASAFFRDAAAIDKKREEEQEARDAEREPREVKKKVSIALQYV